MPFKIIRNDITRMNTQAIVNTANENPTVGTGCDHAVFEAAGYEELLSYRKEHIGIVPEGEAFITPGFRLPAKYIIHAVSPLYIDGEHGEEALLRSCYRNSLKLAGENGIQSIAFPLISTGGFGYPKEEGMRIAVDEIHAFLLNSSMEIYLVVFDEKATQMGRNLYPELEAYIDRKYVDKKRGQEYSFEEYSVHEKRVEATSERREAELREARRIEAQRLEFARRARMESAMRKWRESGQQMPDASALPPLENMAPMVGAAPRRAEKRSFFSSVFSKSEKKKKENLSDETLREEELREDAAIEEIEKKLAERIKHRDDTFSQYLLYLISKKGLENADVYKRAIVDKKVFSKIKNNPDYHPTKLTALCLCIGAELNMDETRDLLARAGYALSPSFKTDIIFSFFIENEIYDMIELDIQLEEHGEPCIIT